MYREASEHNTTKKKAKNMKQRKNCHHSAYKHYASVGCWNVEAKKKKKNLECAQIENHNFNLHIKYS